MTTDNPNDVVEEPKDEEPEDEEPEDEEPEDEEPEDGAVEAVDPDDGSLTVEQVVSGLERAGEMYRSARASRAALNTVRRASEDGEKAFRLLLGMLTDREYARDVGRKMRRKLGL